MRLIYTAFICFLSSISLAVPMEFITFQPSSQYYDTAITQDWAQLAFYGGRVNVHTQPKVNYTIAKNLQSSDILALGNVVFGIEPAVGYTYFKGDGNALEGTAKSLTTVDAIVDNLYIYGAKFPATGGKGMRWETFDVELAGGGRASTATYLVIDTEEVEEPLACEVKPLVKCSEIGCPYPDFRSGLKDDRDVEPYVVKPGTMILQGGPTSFEFLAGQIYYDVFHSTSAGSGVAGNSFYYRTFNCGGVEPPQERVCEYTEIRKQTFSAGSDL